MKHYYFVSFNYELTTARGYGFGMAEVCLSNAVISFEDILNIRESLLRQNSEFCNIVIINYKLLRITED